MSRSRNPNPSQRLFIPALVDEEKISPDELPSSEPPLLVRSTIESDAERAANLAPPNNPASVESKEDNSANQGQKPRGI